ncbi:MAG: ribbon-helix-helix protein, CopG family [Caldimonas sp.]|nr:ribbon-helix-helix protein, CopG family [Pseudomonadota bacterium]
MRVNARLDDEAAEQINYLTRATGFGVSHVLRESVALYYGHVRAQRAGLIHLGGLIGKGDSGRSDIASDVKRHLGDSLDAKFRRAAR